VHALLQREPGAPAILFDHYGTYIKRVLARIVGYADPDLMDLLHDVFLRAFERIGDLKNPRALKPWLVGIALFVAQEWIRSRKRHGPLFTPEIAEGREGLAAPPETIEAVRAFYALVNQLKHDDRTVFILRFLEGMNLDEVAEACNVSISTARRRISHAEDRFRRILPQYPALLERLETSKRQ
jgi:RNA polymerase sigma-70 factor (ECF subfamily)